jgi:exonuclease III
LANWIKKEEPTICCLQETHLIDRNKLRLRVTGWKIYQANDPQKTGRNSNTYFEQSRLQTYIAQTRLRRTLHTKKGEIHQKEITIVNLYAANISAHNFIKHTLKNLKAYVDSNTVEWETLIPIDRSSKQKINKEILELNHIIDQMDLADIYRIFH